MYLFFSKGFKPIKKDKRYGRHRISIEVKAFDVRARTHQLKLLFMYYMCRKFNRLSKSLINDRVTFTIP